ncbi:3D domain-containing protein [Neptunomonas sp.]|uniref:3D domain-containing protein n=1 Tax=Neptunomonas sp. TaxID=1971898 RepID=UPI00356611E7
MRRFSYFIILPAIYFLSGCSDKTNSLEVTASAYTSHPNETDSTPSLAAWGDTLKPGMKAIAVSRDLIKKGLRPGVEVSIEGLEGKYKVLDKMNKRWRKKIDIYMGKDINKAKDWGNRKVTIHWVSEEPS